MKNQLVRFDWALKKLLRNKANFEILEGFLSELLKQEVKIEKILESETNRETRDDKHNRVDLLTEINSRELVLIELQVEGQFDYFHRMLYGSSKLITDYMVAGFTYKEVKKVISVNIVYFDLGHGEDYVYKGITEFTGIHKHDLLQLSDFQKSKLTDLDKVSSIFPEYYILKVNGFNDYAKDTLDEWIYFLKNSEIKDEFKAKGIHKASEELDILKLSKEERQDYERYLDDWRVGESSIQTSWMKGHDKGREEGREEERRETARKMKQLGIAVETIMQVSGLSREDVDSL
ncbi:MAG: Rpn family recombination-promoting nuclease/putative transposase [Geobacter sp.]|jgi:predicted transposase/invertase (TIGR01784 family)|nr:Rpn family recombination-promoting nuclease/putative transposase [Geobacter sp.]